MQSYLENRTYQCYFCLTYVPDICKEVHDTKCLIKKIQERNPSIHFNEQSQIPQQQDIPSQINFQEKANSSSIFSQTATNSLQPRSDIKFQQNQQNISNINPQGTTNTAINITRQNAQVNVTQEQQRISTPLQQFNRIQQQDTNRNTSNQQFQRFLLLQRTRESYVQQTNNIFRINQEQQQQQVQQVQFPQQQPSFIQTPIGLFPQSQRFTHVNQIQFAPRSTPFQYFSSNSSIFQTTNPTERNENRFPYHSDDSSNEEEIHEVGGLNNFDLFKNYTDEEVNQMNDEQFYQYFIQKQIAENHQDEPNLQIQKMMEQQKDDNQCVICQDSITSEDEMMVLDCQHKFHQDCISNWIRCKSTCPICKIRI